MHVYGIDPALRHGAVVVIEVNTIQKAIRQWDLVCYWKHGIKTGSDLSCIRNLALRVSSSLLPYPGLTGGVDYTYETIFWKAGKLQLVTMALFMGILYEQLIHQQNPPTIFSAQAVYSAFSMKHRSTKIDLHHTFLDSVAVPSPPKIGGDIMDAIILAYLSAL